MHFIRESYLAHEAGSHALGFAHELRRTYRRVRFDAPSIDIGHILRDGKPAAELPIRVPLRMMNRHGMIAGSTGTGKTRTLQLLAEGLSRAGVPVFLADVKGDLAGMCLPGETNERLTARAASVGRTHTPEAFPVEFFSLTGNHGTQVRATVSTFGPVLLGKVLDLTDVQQSAWPWFSNTATTGRCLSSTSTTCATC